MSRIQQVLFELTTAYVGHPYYVSGNAIVHALGQRVPREVREHLGSSHGVFVPGQMGRHPEIHSSSGVNLHLGRSLPDVVAYDDLFVHRHAEQAWLLDSGPREAFNTHDVQPQARQPGLAQEMALARPKEHRHEKQRRQWHIHANLHERDDADVLPIAEEHLDGLQFGGKRNYGYGRTKLKASQVVDLDALDYSRLEEAEDHRIELVTPFVLESTYPDADDHPVPWWWIENREDLRVREEKLVEQREVFELVAVDHGQVIGYNGDRPVETAKNGLFGVGSHSRYGFGEIRVKLEPNPHSTSGDCTAFE